MIDKLMQNLQDGKWVYGIHPEISSNLMETADACHELNGLPPSHTVERECLLRGLLGSMGKGVTINPPFRCDFGNNIFIGDNVTVNFGMTVLDEAKVSIGNRVFIGPNVSIYTIIHALDAPQRYAGVMRAEPVIIEDDVWICGDVKILPGVTIGKGAVIGAGSVVTRSVPPMTLAAGNPCRPLRSIDANDIIEPNMIFAES